MDRFNELERIWEERQKKRKLALMAIGGSMMIVLVVYLAFPKSPANTPKPETSPPVAQAEAVVKTADVTPKPEPKPKPEPAPQTAKPAPRPEPEPAVAEKKPVLQDPLTITLDRSFQERIETELETYRQKRHQPAQTQPQEATVTEPPQTENETEPTLLIKSETVDDSEKIGLLIDNYEFDENYENAMKIARHYFASESYQEAIKWSLSANQLNSADDESWLIFAKSSIAVGETEQAKKALQTYLLKRDSLRIRQLYQSIK